MSSFTSRHALIVCVFWCMYWQYSTVERCWNQLALFVCRWLEVAYNGRPLIILLCGPTAVLFPQNWCWCTPSIIANSGEIRSCQLLKSTPLGMTLGKQMPVNMQTEENIMIVIIIIAFIYSAIKVLLQWRCSFTCWSYVAKFDYEVKSEVTQRTSKCCLLMYSLFD